MKPKTVYVCEICGRQDSPGEAMMCEEKHILPQKIVEEVRKQHDGIKKLYEQGLRGATANVEQVLDLFDTIEAIQQENEQLYDITIFFPKKLDLAGQF